MGYDISFLDPVSKQMIQLEHTHHMHGGTYAIGGTSNLEFYITFNYAEIYSKHNFNVVDDLNGKLAVDVIPVLDRVISELGDDTDPDYWNPTEGNAKRALITLRTMAKMRPDALIEAEA